MSRFSGQKTKYFLGAFLLGASFLFCLPKASAWHTVSTYEKLTNGTLTAAEWNSLLYSPSNVAGAGDFVTTWLPASMNGPLGIATSAPASGLEVNGIIRGTTISGALVGSLNAANISSGPFGANYGGGPYSFPGNLGIGTTAPTQKLEVVGNILNTGYLMQTDTWGIKWKFAGDSDTVEMNQSELAFKFNIAGSINKYRFNTTKNGFGPILDLNTNGSSVFYGNVGIGTTGPASKLHIFNTGSGDGTWNQGILIENSNATPGETALSFRNSSTASSYWFTGLNQGVDYNIAYGTSFTDATTKLRITSNGNVGINTVAPAAKLDVNGTFRASSALISGLAGAGTALVLTDNAGNLYATSTSIILPEGTVSLPSGASGQTLRYTGSSWVANSTLYNNGTNVGIGTTSPAFKLDVFGSSRFSENVRVEAGKNLIFYDHNGAFPTAQGGFQWDLNNDDAKIYAQQPSSDSIDFVFKLSDNALATERFIYWVDDYNGETYDAYPLTMDATKIVFNRPTVYGTGTSKDTDFYLMGNGSSNLSQAYLFGDAANKNVGIGTTAPGTKLDVPTGFFRALGGTVSGLGSAGNVVVMADNSGNLFSTTTAAIMPQGTVSLPGGTSGQTLRYSGSAWVANSNLYNNGTNVGIGTTAPASKLHIFTGTDSDVGNGLRLFGSNPDGVRLTAWSNDAGNYSAIYSWDENDGGTGSFATLRLGNSTDGTKGINIIPSGSVGIGTTNPAYKLDVNGDSRISGNLVVGTPAAHPITGLSMSGSYVDPTSTSRGVFYVFTTDAQAQGKGGIITLGGDYNGTDTTFARIAGLKENSTSGNYSSYLAFYTRTHGQTTQEQMRISSGGNVGIGSTAPGAKLDLPTGFFRALGGTVTGLGSAGNVVVMADNSGNLFATSSSSFISNNSLDLWAGSKTGNIYNNNSGNVGIGTTAPGALLHLHKDGAQIKLTNSSNPAGYYSTITQNYNYSGPSFQINSTSGGSAKEIFGRYSENLAIMKDGGNVGIGTTTPTEKLQVIGNILIPNNSSVLSRNVGNNVSVPLFKFNTADALEIGTWEGNYVSNTFIKGGNGSVYVDFSQGNNANFIVRGVGGTTPYEYMRVTSAGNLGIGSATPGTKLDLPAGFFRALGGTVSGLGSAGNVLVMADNSGNLFSTSTSAFLSTNSGWTLNGTNVYKTNTSGNVGIGTTNPLNKLEVSSATFTTTYSSSHGVRFHDNQFGINLGGLDANSVGVIQGSNYGVGAANISMQMNGGNVGVGTTNPLAKFQVNGNSIFGNAFAAAAINGSNMINILSGAGGVASTTGISFWEDTTSAMRLSYDGSGAGATNALRIYDFNSNPLVSFQNGGNVGIGSVTPGVKLDLPGGFFRASGGSVTGLGSAGNVLVMADNSGNLFSTSTSAFLSTNSGWTLNGTNVYKTNTSGNVGVGTTAPVDKLHINGSDNRSISVTAGGQDQRIVFRQSDNGNSNLSYAAIQGYLTSGSAGQSAGFLSFLTAPGTPSVLVERMRIDSTGNVGIGTTNPLAKLSVFGTGRFGSSDNVYMEIYGNGSSARAGQNNDSSIPVSLYGAGNVQINIDSNNNETIRYFSVNNNAVQNGAELFRVQENGNVGIGSTAPGAKLDLPGGFFRSSGGTVTGLGSAGNVLVMADNSGNLFSTSTSAFLSSNSGWTVSGTNVYKTNTNGNVGIGTTNPLTSLDIKASSPITRLTDSRNTNWIGGEILGSIQSYTSDTSDNGAHVAASVDFISDYTGITSPTGAIRFLTSSYPGDNFVATEKVRISSNGNVGVGTISPASTLHLRGNSGSNTALTFTSFSENGGSNQNAKITYSGAGANSLDFSTGYSSTGNKITFSPSALTAMTILGSGNVGIGSTAPGVKLDLPTGFFRASGGTVTGLGSAGNVLVMADNSGNLFSTSTSAFLSTNSGWTLNGANVYKTNTSGNVGIGTASPSYKLDVRSSTDGTLARIHAYDGTRTQGLYIATSLVSPYTVTLSSSGHSSGDLALNTGNDERMRIAKTGNVGIGTTNSVAKLHVYASGASGFLDNLATAIFEKDDSRLQIKSSDDGNYGSGLILSTASSSWSMMAQTSSNANKFYIGYRASTASEDILSASSKLFAINTSGNVGIGSTAPGVKLDLPGGFFRSSGGTVTGLGSAGNVLVMADNSGNLFSTSTSAFLSTNSGWTLNGTNVYKTNTSGNVGIGTTNPVAKLHVNGNIYLSSTNPYGGISYFNAQKEQNVSGTAVVTGAGWYRIAHIDGSNGRGQNTVTVYTTGGSYVPRSTTIRWFHDWGTSSGINAISEMGSSYWNQARVTSDGTNSFLEVYFTQAITVYLSMQYDGGYVNGFLYDGTLTAGGGSVETTIPLGLFSVGNKLLVDTAGNVGIGTTNPSKKLQVQQTSTSPAMMIGGGYYGYPRLQIYGLDADANAFMGFGADMSGGPYELSMYTSNYNGMGKITFGTYNGTTYNQKMVMLNNGNLGIGSTAPSAKLDLSGGFFKALGGTVTGLGSAGNVLVMADNSGNLFSTSTSAFLSSNSGWTVSGNDIYKTNTSGNVGIGTNSPVTSLSIKNSTYRQLSLNGGSGHQTLNLGSVESTIGSYIYNNAYYSSSYNYLPSQASASGIQFQNDGSIDLLADTGLTIGTAYLPTSRVKITSTGNVGIGTTNPGTYRLYVNGNTNIAGNLNVTGTSTAAAFVGPVTGTINAVNISSGPFGANTGGGPYTFPGNVGIGTTAAGSKLHVLGITQITDGVATADTASYATFGVTRPASASALAYIAMTRAANVVKAMGIDSSNNWIFGAPTSGTQVISNPWMTINTSGNFGIGTAPGSYRLKVGGDVAITGTLLTQTGSDFAEEFKAKAALLPGTVVVMGDEGYKSVKPCAQGYDKTVVGIVSDNPSIIAGRTDIDNENPEKVVVAMMGVVKVKVTALGGQIERGDLLTTSSLSGYAMKATSEKQGTIIGKALEDLKGEQGEIKVLVNLQ